MDTNTAVTYKQEISPFLPQILLWELCFQSSIKRVYSGEFSYYYRNSDIPEVAKDLEGEGLENFLYFPCLSGFSLGQTLMLIDWRQDFFRKSGINFQPARPLQLGWGEK